MTKESRKSLEVGKGKEMDAHLEPPERTPQFEVGLVRSTSSIDL